MNHADIEAVIMQRWETDLAAMSQILTAVTGRRIDEGSAVPAVVAALVRVAHDLSEDHAVTVGPAFFERCVREISKGGTGLCVDDRPFRRGTV